MQAGIKQIVAYRCPLPPFLRRLGLVGFLFFFLKGMLWLTVPGLILHLGF